MYIIKYNNFTEQTLFGTMTSEVYEYPHSDDTHKWKGFLAIENNNNFLKETIFQTFEYRFACRVKVK